VRYELGSYIPEDDVLHSRRRENFISYKESQYFVSSVRLFLMIGKGLERSSESLSFDVLPQNLRAETKKPRVRISDYLAPNAAPLG
jgi:hypothetical protein